MKRYLEMALHFSSHYFITAFGCFISSYPLLLALHFLVGLLPFRIEIVEASGYAMIWMLPSLFLAFIYSLLVTPFVVWLKDKEIYGRYYLYILRYVLFVPFFVIVAGSYCMRNMCYI